MTLLVSLFLKQGGADGGNTPALFLASGQRASGVHVRPMVGWLKDHPFLYEPSLSTIWRQELFYRQE